VEKVPLSELVEDVMAGRIPDAKTQTAILKAARILGM
jgi:ADP-ribose pyrophosphatase